ncbi:MAG: alpha/beta hydrolase [Acidimicrobiales bacterium]
MASPIMHGAEPFAADGGPHGVLLLHGFTGNCYSVSGVAHRFADLGWAVECPLLPGHGTTLDDMLPTGWSDWSAAAEEAFERLAARVEGRIVVVGLSMGGALTVWLATRHPDIAGIVCINPWVAPAGQLRDIVQAGIDSGQEVIASIGSDIADPDANELSYPGSPLRPMLSLFDGVNELQPDLARVACPILLVTSRHDHVVPPFNSDHLASAVAVPVERVWLERSYHVATLDYDKDEVESRTIEFATKVAAA